MFVTVGVRQSIFRDRHYGATSSPALEPQPRVLAGSANEVARLTEVGGGDRDWTQRRNHTQVYGAGVPPNVERQALVDGQAPVQALRLGYGVAMVGLALLLMREAQPSETDAIAATTNVGTPRLAGEPDCGAAPGAAFTPSGDKAHPPCPMGTARQVTAADGTTYVYCAHGLRGQQLLSGIGAFFAGLISTGVGEATLPGLVRRSRFPIAVAAATSTVVVAGTVVGAALTHMAQLAADGGFAAIPWNLIVWAVPGAVLGAVLGTGLQGKVSPRVTRWFFSGLFFTIGVTFLLAFTVFKSTFG